MCWAQLFSCTSHLKRCRCCLYELAHIKWQDESLNTAAVEHCSAAQLRSLFYLKRKKNKEQIKKKSLGEKTVLCSSAGQRPQRVLTNCIVRHQQSTLTSKLNECSSVLKSVCPIQPEELISVKLLFHKGFCSSFICFYTHPCFGAPANRLPKAVFCGQLKHG